MTDKIQAILFDLDGTLVDTVLLHFNSLNRALQEIERIEISPEESVTTYNGLPTKTKLNMLCEKGLISEANKVLIECLKQKYTWDEIRNTIRPDPEKIKLLDFLSNKVKLGCVTNCIEETTNLLLQYSGLWKYFNYTINTDLIRYPKPNSEGWIQSMVFLESYPSETIAIEDSDKGWESIKNTGMYCWRVKNSHEVTLDNLNKYLLENNLHI